ncbi:hypothetical protein [Gemmobacter serpentinus]|uniref:hypothetical protein n=1 Tax=Gemmobacter serpentinus TaxID=2652247 RepID=UPI00124C48D4|nr:hypothetical protein [Gemmobacter serpentinus]
MGPFKARGVERQGKVCQERMAPESQGRKRKYKRRLDKLRQSHHLTRLDQKMKEKMYILDENQGRHKSYFQYSFPFCRAPMSSVSHRKRNIPAHLANASYTTYTSEPDYDWMKETYRSLCENYGRDPAGYHEDIEDMVIQHERGWLH